MKSDGSKTLDFTCDLKAVQPDALLLIWLVVLIPLLKGDLMFMADRNRNLLIRLIQTFIILNWQQDVLLWSLYDCTDAVRVVAQKIIKGTYDFVEVLCDLNDADGLPPNEMLRFSYTVWSFTLTETGGPIPEASMVEVHAKKRQKIQ
ncbi:hypothetical protein Bca4012_067412 [Brassica carinata]